MQSEGQACWDSNGGKTCQSWKAGWRGATLVTTGLRTLSEAGCFRFGRTQATAQAGGIRSSDPEAKARLSQPHLVHQGSDPPPGKRLGTSSANAGLHLCNSRAAGNVFLDHTSGSEGSFQTCILFGMRQTGQHVNCTNACM